MENKNFYVLTIAGLLIFVVVVGIGYCGTKSQKERLSEAYRKVKEQLEAEKKKTEKLGEKIGGLEDELREAEDRIGDLETEIENKKREIELKRELIEDKRRRIRELERALANSGDNDSAALRAELVRQQQQSDSLESQVHQLSTENNSLRSDKERLEQIVEQLRSMLAQERARADSLQEIVSNVESLVKTRNLRADIRNVNVDYSDNAFTFDLFFPDEELSILESFPYGALTFIITFQNLDTEIFFQEDNPDINNRLHVVQLTDLLWNKGSVSFSFRVRGVELKKEYKKRKDVVNLIKGDLIKLTVRINEFDGLIVAETQFRLKRR